MSKTKENEASPRLHKTKMLRSSVKSSQCEKHPSSLEETVSISLESNTTRTEKENESTQWSVSPIVSCQESFDDLVDHFDHTRLVTLAKDS